MITETDKKIILKYAKKYNVSSRDNIILTIISYFLIDNNISTFST